MGRVRVYEAEDIARDMRETFTAKKVSKQVRLPRGWPAEMQDVGESLAVAYSSDKWKSDGDLELYKHLAESPNHALCVPGFLRNMDSPGKAWPVIGPTIDLSELPMPRDFAVLALFEEANLRLYTKGTDENPRFGRKASDGCVKVVVKHGMLGGGKILWSRTSRRKDQPFLFVYTEADGPLVIIVGQELDVLADGIVG